MSDKPTLKAAWRITADDQDVTAAIIGRFVSLTITDKPGVDSDEVELTVHDRDGKLALPRRGVILRVAIGWAGQSLIDKGSYQVDEVEHSGPPDVVKVKAKAAGLGKDSTIKEQRDHSWSDKSLADVLSDIAKRNGLTAAIDADLGKAKLAHIDQTNESDANFLTRLGQQYDATATIKDGRLIFLPNGSGKSASGIALPSYSLTRKATVNHSLSLKDRDGDSDDDEKDGVKAQYRDLAAAETKTALAGSESGSVKTLRRVYPTEGEAQAAATAAKAKAKRDAREIRLSCAVGMPDLIAGQPLRLSGWRPEIDEIKWVVEDVTHTLDGSGGLQTSLTAKG